jgi:hypothetical protein
MEGRVSNRGVVSYQTVITNHDTVRGDDTCPLVDEHALTYYQGTIPGCTQFRSNLPAPDCQAIT